MRADWMPPEPELAEGNDPVGVGMCRAASRMRRVPASVPGADGEVLDQAYAAVNFV
jgi:hypothetical protein